MRPLASASAIWPAPMKPMRLFKLIVLPSSAKALGEVRFRASFKHRGSGCARWAAKQRRSDLPEEDNCQQTTRWTWGSIRVWSRLHKRSVGDLMSFVHFRLRL